MKIQCFFGCQEASRGTSFLVGKDVPGYGRRELRGSIQIKNRGSAAISGSFRSTSDTHPPSPARPEAAAVTAALAVASRTSRRRPPRLLGLWTSRPGDNDAIAGLGSVGTALPRRVYEQKGSLMSKTTRKPSIMKDQLF
ncbi:hypothetical protein B0H14DRAFT_2601346 [Mycena olivaceomarginata]|nr:hypothetical protein B0H14DRAFT_2601346 [Mycena olivaceomarginata]